MQGKGVDFSLAILYPNYFSSEQGKPPSGSPDWGNAMEKEESREKATFLPFKLHQFCLYAALALAC